MDPEAHPSPLKTSNAAIVVIVLAVVAGGIWFIFGREQAPAPAPAPAEPAPPATAEAAPAPEAGPAGPEDARALLEAASPNASWRGWLGAGDHVGRAAAVIENVATGASPRAHVPFLRPGSPFSVVTVGGREVIAPASYARYDGFADAVGSLDAGAIARAWRALHDALDAAYAALGYPRGGIDRAVARALDRIAAAPVRDGDVAVVDEGGVWVFEDPKLERLGEVDKHLLRMGPRNTRILQAKARELRAALAFPAVVPAAAPAR